MREQLRYSQELYQLYQSPDIIRPKKIYEVNLHHKQPKGRSKARWKDDVQNDIRKMCIVNWRQVAQDRDGYRGATREALILLG